LLQLVTVGEKSMKPFRLVPIVACFSILCALFSSVAFALDQDEAIISLSWSSQALYQGSNVTVTLFFKSECAEELMIYCLGLQFDWMASDIFVGRDLSDDPVTIPSYGSYIFDPMTISIPENASVGTHSYFIGIDGLQGESTSFFWDSQTLMLVIQVSVDEAYDELRTNVANNITEADNATYQSSEAQSLLEQAKTAYDQALSLANEEKWEEAISALQDASTYLEQADVEEQNYIEAESQQDHLLIIVVVVVVVVAVLIIVLIVRRKRKQTAPADQPTET
jgi:hypothetical protein